MHFAAQLSAQVSAGFILGSLGKYVAVVLGGNLIQFFIVLPSNELFSNVINTSTFPLFTDFDISFFTSSSKKLIALGIFTDISKYL